MPFSFAMGLRTFLHLYTVNLFAQSRRERRGFGNRIHKIDRIGVDSPADYLPFGTKILIIL